MNIKKCKLGFNNMSDYCGLRIFIKLRKNTYFSSVERGLSNLH